MGRPTKIEGNPEHPASLGATDAFTQARSCTLYDPDRSQVVLAATGAISTWERLPARRPSTIRAAEPQGQGAGLRVLTETVTSPTPGSTRSGGCSTSSPRRGGTSYEPVGRDDARAGARLAFGEDVEPVYHFDQADVILSLDADFLACGPGRAALRPRLRRAARARARTRRRDEPALRGRVHADRSPGRWPTTAWPLPAGHDRALSPQAVAQRLGDRGRAGGDAGRLGGAMRRWIAALVARPGGRTAGRAWSSPATRSRRPSTPWPTRSTTRWATSARRSPTPTPVEAEPGRPGRLARPSSVARHGGRARSTCSLILGGNPAYDAPADLNFAAALRARSRSRIHLGLYEDETVERLPLAHPRGPLPGGLGRRPGLRRHGHDPAAADRAALRGPVGASNCSRSSWASRPLRLRDRPRLLDEARTLRGRLRGRLADGRCTTGSSPGRPRPRRPVDARSCRGCRRRRHRAGGRRAGWSSSSGPTRRSGTAGSPTTAGSRSCPSR